MEKRKPLWYIFVLDKCVFMSLVPKGEKSGYYLYIQKAICAVLVSAFLITQILPTSIAFAQSTGEADSSAVRVGGTVIPKAGNQSSPSTVYDLVVFVVDKELDRDSSSYVGLMDKFSSKLRENTISGRIMRYANDVAENNKLTDVKILFYDKQKDTVPKLANALENLYVNGDGTHNNRLVGAVFTGDVPMPVVNNNGERFMSVFPYTDFDDKAYIFNPTTNSFEKNPNNTAQKAEVWHGIIRGGTGKLASFFDKNHLYYIGEPEYAKFDKKLFFADLVDEDQKINSDVYKYYVKYLNSAEDLAYMRYNKSWANALSGNILSDINADVAAADIKPTNGSDFSTSFSNSALTQLPDIYSKNVIDQFLIPYFQIFPKFISQINEFVEGTGRYEATDADNVPVLISIKDEYTKNYLKIVNDAFEKKINEVVAKIEEPLPLLRYSKLTGFVENGPQFSVSDTGLVPTIYGGVETETQNFNEIFLRYNFSHPYTSDNESNQKVYIKGVDADVIQSAKLCAPYLGSTTLTKSMRSDDKTTLTPVYTIGINARLLSPEEANSLTGNKASQGAVIEDNAAYGIGAFILNPIRGDINLKNPLQGRLQKGDVITKVNGKDINYLYSFDQAIIDSYNNVKKVIDAVNANKRDDLNGFPYPIIPDDYFEEHAEEMDTIAGAAGIEFYRGSQKMQIGFTFTVKQDGSLNKNHEPQAYVLLTSMANPSDFIDMPESDGAIFTSSGLTYSNTAGCDASLSPETPGDKYRYRCFYPFATVPVLDPAGSVAIVPNGDIDETYYNACYDSLPDLGPAYGNGFGIYSKFFNNYLGFINRYKDTDVQDRPGLIPGKNDVWMNIEELNADKVILNQADNIIIKLSDFARAAGIEGGNISEIARKLLSHNATYMIPATFSFLGKSLVLKVEIVPYLDNNGQPKTISSMILHNEPTPYTISQELKLATQSLPIDNPRYVAFQAKAKTPAVMQSSLVTEDGQGYFDKETYKIYYPSLFKYSNIAQFKADLTSIADKLAAIPGSQKIFRQNANPNDYTALQIREKILNDYLLPVIVTGPEIQPDYPNDIKLQTTSEAKLADGIKWMSSSIDDKHSYILENYLNGEKNSFAGDSTLYPAPYGYQPKFGYESAYLVLNGSADSFDTNFNKDIPDETDRNFDPLTILQNEADAEDAEASQNPDEEDWEFVWLDDFLKELEKFIRSFTQVPKLNYSCGAAPQDDDNNPQEEGQTEGQVGGQGQTGGSPQTSTGRHIELVSYTYIVPEGTEELLQAIETGNTNIGDNSGTDTTTNINNTQWQDSATDFAQQIINSQQGVPSASTTTPSSSLNENSTSTGTQDNNGSGTPKFEREIKDVIQQEQQAETEIQRETGTNATGTPYSPPSETQGSQGTQSSPGSAPEEMKWEQYFILKDYYKKFIESNASSSRVRMFAYIPNDQNPFIDAEVNPESEYAVMTNDEMVADNASLMMVSASIYNSEGILETNKNLNVKFSITGSDAQNIVTFENGDTAQTTDGIATVYLKAGKIAGHFKLHAEVLNGNYPATEKELHLTAGPISTIDISSNSYALLANGQSKVRVSVVFKDKFGNTADNSFAQATLFAGDGAYFDPKVDLDSQILGTQISSLEGVATADLYAKNEPGDVTIIALLMDYDLQNELAGANGDWDNIDFSKYIGASKKFNILDGMTLKFAPSALEISADGNSVASIGVKLLYNGQTVTSYNGPINFKILNDKLGKFVAAPPTTMVWGALHEANVKFKSSTLAGDAEILVTLPGFISDTIKIKTLPGPPYKIELASSADTVNTGGADEVILESRLLDKYGNLVDTDNSTLVKFSTSETQQVAGADDFINFQGVTSAVALKGVASIVIKGGDRSGVANITAKASGVQSGILSLKVKSHIDSNDVADFAPRALYVSLLGGGFGNISNNNNLAQTMLQSGQVQAVSTVTKDTNNNQRLVSVDGYGKVDVLSEDISTTVAPATDSFPYQKVVFGDKASMFLIPKSDSSIVLIHDNEEIGDGEGIFVKRISSSDPQITFTHKDDGIYIEKDGEPKVKIDNFGRIIVNDSSLKLRLPDAEDNVSSNAFSLVIEDRNEALALIKFKQNFTQDVHALKYNETLSGSSFYPGVYFQLSSSENKYKFIPEFSGSSTDEPLGLALVDTANDRNVIGNTSGVGFDGKDKHMLLFGAGNSVGESNMPYANDSAVVFGDPLIRLQKTGITGLISELSGYTKDLGKLLYSSEEKISEILPFDYNGDGRDDILLIYESGLIRLLENDISNKKLVDKGNLLNVYGGIFSAAKIDVNNDGVDDLIVGTKESCNANEECVSLFINNEGHFERKALDLSIDGKIFEMKSADMNSDGCEDLVATDAAGNLRVFYNTNNGNECFGLETNYGENNNFNFGFSIDGQADSKNNLFIKYNGMAPYSEANSDKFVLLVVPSDQEPVAVDADQEVSNETHFINLTEDAKFKTNSTKKMTDVNGGTVAVGDKIDVVITLKNISGTSVNGLMLSDLIPTTMSVDEASFKCIDSDCQGTLSVAKTGMDLRPYVVKNLNIPARGKRTIKYTMTVKEVPKIHFDVGNNFTTYETAQGNAVAPDAYMDILVKPEFNPEGVLTYLYSTGISSDGYVQFGKMQVEATPSNGSANDTVNYDDLLSSMNARSGDDLSPALKNKVNSQVSAASQDSNYDGCPDSWSAPTQSNETSLDSIANDIKDIAGNLRCKGEGCAPIPYNYAFLTPGDFLNIPGATVPGLPVFSIIPSFPFVAPFYPTSSASFFRIYVSPTLTGGFGTAICVGPAGSPPAGLASPCFAFALPIKFKGLCPDIFAPLNNAIAQAKNSNANPDVGMSTIVSDGSGSKGTEAITGNFKASNSGLPVSVAGSVNLRIPGFPSVITDWLDKQTDEIFNKLLDLPDLYFIYPDVNTLIPKYSSAAANFGKIKNISDVLAAINSIPLVQIEGKEVLLKLPAISKNDWTRWKRQAEAWVKYEEEQLRKIEEYWTCNENPTRKTVCDKVRLDATKLISSIKKLMAIVDKIANLPREILNWRNLESKYASQIICYLDAIMNYTGGYIKKQSRIVTSWMKAIEDVIRNFRSWRVILDVIAEYQASCDQCKSDRLSKLGVLLQFFAAIPPIPIIPIPKWPDIVFDISQIKTGVKIIWPDVIFRPEPIRLPDLPYFTLPDVLPDYVYKIPGFDIDLGFNLDNFALPHLPDLPPLPLPQLPDLPRPPKIPKMPDAFKNFAAALKPIFKILCLLKKGLIPVPESALGTEIETLTQPSVQTVTPMLKALGMQMPAIQYNYVDQIKVTAKLNMGINTDFIYDFVKQGAEKANKEVKDFVNQINKVTRYPIQQIIDGAIKKAEEEAKKAINNAIQDQTGIEIKNTSGSLPLAYESLQNQLKDLSDSIKNFSKDLSDDVSETTPDIYYLTASEQTLSPSDPLLNRSISEIEANNSNIDVSSPQMQQLKDLRDSLIAYTKNLNDSNDLLKNINDYDSFIKVLAETDSAPPKFASLSATDNEEEISLVKKLKTTFFGDEITKSTRLLADNGLPSSPQEAIFDAQNPTSAPKGFFVAVGNTQEKVLSYTAELGGSVNTVFNDVDDDGDADILFSFGGDIYLKENYKNNDNLPRGTVILNSQSSISDYYVKGGQSVQNITSPYENNDKADVQWLASSYPSVIGYDVIIKKSLFDNEDDAVYRETVDNVSNLSVELPNGNYYAVVYALDKDGNRSISPSPAIVAPQSCADKEAPLPAITQTNYDVSLFKTLEIDASGSFDTSGEIDEYYLELVPATGQRTVLWSDLNVSVDENGDGIPDNDKTNPRFTVGPFENATDIGEHKAILHIVDQSGNSSQQEITFNVLAPDITLNETLSRIPVASGKVTPVTADLPFSLMRSRYIYRVSDGELKIIPTVEKILTPSVSSNGKYYTDANGEYSILDMTTDDMILLKNSLNETVAEISPVTGNIGSLKTGYSLEVLTASPSTSLPTRIVIIDAAGNVLGTLYMIADPNQDVQIGVNAIDTNSNDSFEWRNFPADDPTYPGGASLVNKSDNKQMAIVDSAGNVLLLDNGMQMRKKENNYKVDPFVIQLIFDGKVVGEIVISPINKNINIVGPNDVPFATPRAPVSSFFQSTSIFPDATGQLLQIAENLNSKHVVDGVQTDQGLMLKPDQLVNRSEFIKILLNMLCVIPREDSYKPYASGGYSDIAYSANNLPWFYPYIKEASTLNFVNGYKGETDSQTGLHPFRPERTISRAEAVKVILEALEYKGVLDLSSLSEGTGVWYAPLIDAAQNLTPYVKAGQTIRNNFIITLEEAATPDKRLTRAELMIMTNRVLDVYNCFEIDANHNGLSDFCEAKYKISDPKADPDNDVLSNLMECSYGTDPTKKDTDGGGVLDGDEIRIGSNPLNPADDRTLNVKPVTKNKDEKQPESGYYLVPAACTTCPCQATFTHKADIIPGDKFFSVISTYNESHIFSKSNEVIIQNVTK